MEYAQSLYNQLIESNEVNGDTNPMAYMALFGTIGFAIKFTSVFAMFEAYQMYRPLWSISYQICDGYVLAYYDAKES